MVRRIAALSFIFFCATLGWVILGATIMDRTGNSDEQLKEHVGSTWGAAQQQAPPTASYSRSEVVPRTIVEQGRIITRNENVEHRVLLRLNSSRVWADIRLAYRQKGLLWYSTYTVDFAGDYTFQNPSEHTETVHFRLPFPAQKALYDRLILEVNRHPLSLATDEQATSGDVLVPAKQITVLHVAYRSQGLDSWQYKLADGVAEVHDFLLTMHTNFSDIDFADDTLSPTDKQWDGAGWKLIWHYSDLVSGFEIGMRMPQKLQPGPLAGRISYFAPVSLFFFFFLIFIITSLRRIDLHPMNYFFLAAAFFAFHLLLAYLVDHISIHVAMLLSSAVSVALVISYLRLVVGIRFAALEAGAAQLIYLVIFSYAFFWKGFTGLSITVISVLTLFIVMQATGRIRWSETLR